MIKHEITYVNFDDETKTDTVWFHINKAVLGRNVEEMMKRMEGVKALLEAGQAREEVHLTPEDVLQVQSTLEYFIGLSYGIRDGEEFIQTLDDGRPAINRFRNGPIYPELVFDLMQTQGGAIRFIINVLPTDMLREAVAEMAKENPEQAEVFDNFRKTGSFDTPTEATAEIVVEEPIPPTVEELEARLAEARKAQES